LGAMPTKAPHPVATGLGWTPHSSDLNHQMFICAVSQAQCLLQQPLNDWLIEAAIMVKIREIAEKGVFRVIDELARRT